MKKRRFAYILIGIGLILSFGSARIYTFTPAGNSPFIGYNQAAAGKQEIVYKPLPKSGKKYEIGDDIYFIYEFSERPKIGTIVLKIRVFNKKGEKITPYAIKGRSDMPSMRGAHDSGDIDFKLNKKNDYLLPVNIVMPGGWEVRMTFIKDGKPVFFGSIAFDV